MILREIRRWIRLALDAPCDPGPQSEKDPYSGVVTGPELVARTKHNHARHQARYLDDEKLPPFPVEFDRFQVDDLAINYSRPIGDAEDSLGAPVDLVDLPPVSSTGPATETPQNAV